MGDLSSYIKDKRNSLGWTQAVLAERADVSRDLVAQIESGKSKLPQPENRRKLAKALGVTHLQMLIEAGEITQAELGTVAGLVEQDPTDPRLELVALLRRIRLSQDRETGLRALLRGWLEADMEKKEK